MNLARTALVVSTTFALLLGGVPAALAAPTPPVDLPELSGPAEPAATAGAPAGPPDPTSGRVERV